MANDAGESARGARRATAAEVGALASEVLAAFFELRAAGQKLGAVAEFGGGTWGLMKTIAEEGPVTMAEFARRRAVSRQYIQKIANELIARGHVALESNPRHRRSGLLALTPAGRRELRIVSARIDRQLAAWARRLDGRPVADAARTVSEFRQLIAAAR